jgi:hypothetical protein
MSRTPLAESSPVLRFLRPWVRSVPALLTTLLFLAVIAVGWMTSQAGSVAMHYANLNPVRDPALWQRITEGTATPAELESSRALGSALAAETLYLPPPVVLRFLSLGNPAAVADLLFVRAHAYFLSHFFTDRRFEWLHVYVESITALDPDNARFYLWAAQVMKMGQNVDDAVVMQANEFLEQGLTHFPKDWRLHMELGFNLNFELKAGTDAELAANRLRARDHFAIAAGLPGAPIDPNFVAGLFDRNDQSGLATRYALQKYYEATPEQRIQLLRRVGALSEVLAKGLKDEEARWRANWGFVPVSLFSLLDEGERQGRLFALPAAGNGGTP